MTSRQFIIWLLGVLETNRCGLNRDQVDVIFDKMELIDDEPAKVIGEIMVEIAVDSATFEKEIVRLNGMIEEIELTAPADECELAQPLPEIDAAKLRSVIAEMRDILGLNCAPIPASPSEPPPSAYFSPDARQYS